MLPYLLVFTTLALATLTSASSSPPEDPCNQLINARNEILEPSAVVSPLFIRKLDGISQCARNALMKLKIHSSAHCDNVGGKSNHKTGTAIDFSIRLPNGKLCKRDCMGEAYCAFHRREGKCQQWYKTKGGRQFLHKFPPRNKQNSSVNSFFNCIGGPLASARYAPTHTVEGIKGVGNWVQADGGPPSASYEAQRKSVSKALCAACHGKCPFVRLPGKFDVDGQLCSCSL